MKIEISDKALENDKKGTIISFIQFAEKVYEDMNCFVDETPTNWSVYQDQSKFLTVMNFPKAEYTREEAEAIFNLIVYGRVSLPDQTEHDLISEADNDLSSI